MEIKPFTLNQSRHMSYSFEDKFYNQAHEKFFSERSKSYPDGKLTLKLIQMFRGVSHGGRG